MDQRLSKRLAAAIEAGRGGTAAASCTFRTLADMDFLKKTGRRVPGKDG